MRAATPEEFRADPLGRYVLERRFAVWLRDRSIGGVLVFDGVSPGELERLFALQEVVFDHLGPSPKSLWDVTSVSSRTVTAETIRRTVELAKPRLDWLAAVGLRHAIWVPEGPLGALVVGFRVIAGVSHPWLESRELATLASWLGETEAALADVITPIKRAHGELHGTIAAIREHLAREPAATLDAIALALGCSRRSVQRRLAEHGSTFRHEQRLARRGRD